MGMCSSLITGAAGQGTPSAAGVSSKPGLVGDSALHWGADVDSRCGCQNDTVVRPSQGRKGTRFLTAGAEQGFSVRGLDRGSPVCLTSSFKGNPEPRGTVFQTLQRKRQHHNGPRRALSGTQTRWG